ncbi:MAG: hypothetical protein VKJ04_11870 [Vampirovibrionales bacterium]|nr:hypothetical protein [Vampirovibrionales bacterium]
MLTRLLELYHALWERPCPHTHLTSSSQGGICPDCGYRVKNVWHLLRCRHCGTRRQAKLTFDLRIRPLRKYCAHCGANDYQLIKRHKIHVYEMNYALCLKEIDYSDLSPSAAPVHFKYRDYASHNPFEKPYASKSGFKTSTVYEGQVVKKTELTRPGRLA